MSYPDNPDTIILKNKYYPTGLKEIDVWNHYQRVKSGILSEVKNKDVMFIIMVALNKQVIRRKIPRLTPQDYGILDIDVGNDGYKWAQKATSDVYDFVMDKMPIVRTAQIRFTGKTSFHIKCDFNKKMKADVTRFLFKKFLNDSNLSKIYSIGGTRRSGVPNIDLNRNCLRCNHITLNALSAWGLKCMEIPFPSLMRFDPRQARI
jgi:hypothetical protein